MYRAVCTRGCMYPAVCTRAGVYRAGVYRAGVPAGVYRAGVTGWGIPWWVYHGGYTMVVSFLPTMVVSLLPTMVYLPPSHPGYTQPHHGTPAHRVTVTAGSACEWRRSWAQSRRKAWVDASLSPKVINPVAKSMPPRAELPALPKNKT